MIGINVFARSLPIDGLYNEIIDELRVRGLFISKYSTVKPYFTEKFHLGEQGTTQLDNWLLLRVRKDVPFIECNWVNDTTNTTRIKLNLSYEDDNLAIFVQPVFKFGKDNLHPRRYFDDIVAADYERASVSISPGDFQFLVGRERFSIGPSQYNNLMLSGCGIPLDLIMTSYDAKFFRITMLFSRLNDIYDKTVDFVGDTSDYKVNQFRYIAIKRLDVSLKAILQRLDLWSLESVNEVTLGFTDACVFGGDNVFPDLYYLNPLTIGYISQWTRGDDSNTLICLDGRVDLNNWGFYIQWLIDDYQYAEDENGEPNHTGWNLGVQLVDPIGLRKSFLVAEYTRVSRWTYTYFRPAARYSYCGLPLGHPDGPDFDKLFILGIHHLNEKIDIVSGFYLKRKGETTTQTQWPIPEMPRVPGTYFPEENFLSGVIERSLSISLGLRYYNLPNLSILSNVTYTVINNHKNIAGKDKKYLGLSAFLSLGI